MTSRTIYLIVAVGSRHDYFGHDEWEPDAPGLKAIEDAAEIRRRFLLAFERAEKIEDEAERQGYLTSSSLAGADRRELSGSIPTIARKALYPDFIHRHAEDPRDPARRWPRVLPTFPDL